MDCWLASWMEPGWTENEMKIAMYKRIDGAFDWEGIDEVSDYMEENERYIRTTEPLEVELINLPDVDVIGPQVEALKKEKKKLQAKLAVNLDQIDIRISKLTAITHEG